MAQLIEPAAESSQTLAHAVVENEPTSGYACAQWSRGSNYLRLRTQ